MPASSRRPRQPASSGREPIQRADPATNNEVERRNSPIDGTGVFALRRLSARRKLGEIRGELRRLPRARTEIEDDARIYFIELDGRWALDCRTDTLFKHLNHSCHPNCFLRVFRRRVEVYTLRVIPPGVELTVDYVETPHPGGMPCRCGAPQCRGRL
jgi:SET domain-containing protein